MLADGQKRELRARTSKLPMTHDSSAARSDLRIPAINLFLSSERDRGRLEAVSDRVAWKHGDAELLNVLDAGVEILFAKAPPPAEAAPNLQWLQVSSAGVDYLAGSAPWARGLEVTTARGVYAVPMAEYIMTALLSASQRVGDRRELQAHKEWPSSYIDYECYGLRGKTLVIVGYGGVGRETARLASTFGMRIIAIKAKPSERVGYSYREPGSGDPDGVLPDEIFGLDQIAQAFQQADYVALTLPLTSGSRGLVDRRLLGLLRPEAWIVNVSRGPIIDESSLIDALRDRRIGGAWLDVFETEPLPRASPLWDLPNVVVTPHVSGGNRDSFTVLTDLCCENIRRYVAGEPLLNRVDPEKGY